MLDTKGDVKASKRAIKKEDKDETEVKMIFTWTLYSLLKVNWSDWVKEFIVWKASFVELS